MAASCSSTVAADSARAAPTTAPTVAPTGARRMRPEGGSPAPGTTVPPRPRAAPLMAPSPAPLAGALNSRAGAEPPAVIRTAPSCERTASDGGGGRRTRRGSTAAVQPEWAMRTAIARTRASGRYCHASRTRGCVIGPLGRLSDQDALLRAAIPGHIALPPFRPPLTSVSMRARAAAPQQSVPLSSSPRRVGDSQGRLRAY